MDILKHYVDKFNRDDNELYKNDIDNDHAYEWLREEIPLFSCPDKDLERTYYFRFWTYRKHLKKTEDGYVITEFLPAVPWAKKHNTINAACGFHLREGRWLKNADKYLSDYTGFFLNNLEDTQSYSTWLADAFLSFVSVTGNLQLAKELLPKFCEYYALWEKKNKLENGMFYSIDDRDAMEYSISGCTEDKRMIPGIRPTLNSYMCADARAIAQIAELAGETELSKEYAEKYTALRNLINSRLYKDGFYRAFHAETKEELGKIFEKEDYMPPRELIGYIPWMFNIPTEKEADRFDLLMSEDSFYTKFGPATAERSHPRFLYQTGHMCLWNGYVWPFATSQTLYALENAIDNYGLEKYKKLYLDMLITYAKFHTRTLNDGRTVSWIDESRDPFTDEWFSRAVLEKLGWCGTYERGKDYNHSTFCDHVLGGIVGIKASPCGELTVLPNIPDEWGYFSLENLHFRGECYDIRFEREKGLEIIRK